MPRIPRSLMKDPDRCYHILSRTTGQEYALGDTERHYLLERIRKLSSVYFVRVFTFCLLSNHFHLLVQMQSGDNYSDEEIAERFKIYYGAKRSFSADAAPNFRRRWSDLSEYVKEIKQGFSTWYNRQNDRRGYFWSERFKSVVVEDGSALLSCMAYIDLNPVRANLVDRPEDYRFCGLGYHVQAGNRGRFLSLDHLEIASLDEPPLVSYRRYVYDVGSLDRSDGRRPIPAAVVQKGARSGYRLMKREMFRYRCRYFSESVALGSRAFVKEIHRKLQPYLKTRKGRLPHKIRDLTDLYSFRRLDAAAPPCHP